MIVCLMAVGAIVFSDRTVDSGAPGAERNQFRELNQPTRSRELSEIQSSDGRPSSLPAIITQSPPSSSVIPPEEAFQGGTPSLPRGLKEILQESSPLETRSTDSIVIEPGFPLAKSLASTFRDTNLTQEEQKAIERIAADFDDTLRNSPSVDPDSLDYFNRWRDATNTADERLKAAIGWDRYNRLSLLSIQQTISSP